MATQQQQQQNSHVPKFGGWDSDNNIPYTAFFENARKERCGSIRMNPNDPEQNPEAFNMMIRGNGMRGHDVDDDDNDDASDFSVVAQTPIHPSARKTTSSNNYYSEGNIGQNPNVQTRNPFATDNSVSKEGHPHEKKPFGKKKRSDSDSADQGSEYSLSTSVASSWRPRQRSGSHPSEANHQRAASVPKFGAWDETDPKSGDGYTILFNRIKEEKQSVSATFRHMSPKSRDGQKCQVRNSSGSRFLCCFSSGSA